MNIEIIESGRVAEVFQHEPRAQAIFRKLVLETFSERCAVKGKRLGHARGSAYRRAAVDGCYNVSNGVLLAPTFYKLYDRHLMGIRPDTLTVHFAPGIE